MSSNVFALAPRLVIMLAPALTADEVLAGDVLDAVDLLRAVVVAVVEHDPAADVVAAVRRPMVLFA